MLVPKKAYLHGVDIAYLEGPAAGPHVLLLHGFPGTPQGMAALAEPLTADHHVIALGMRGMPGSDHVGPYDTPTALRDVTTFLDTHLGTPVAAVGHSAGAFLAASMAAIRPDLVSHLVLLDMPLSPDYHDAFGVRVRSTWTAFARALEGGGGVTEMAERLGRQPSIHGGSIADHLDEAAREETVRSLEGFAPGIFSPWVEGRHRELFEPPGCALPGGFRGRVLFIDGDPEEGALCGPDEVAYNMARYPWAERTQLDGVGHDLGLQGGGRVEPLVAAVRTFLV